MWEALFILIVIGIGLYYSQKNKQNAWGSSNRKTAMPSFTAKGKEYSVFPLDNSCSCPDFIKRRAQFSKADPRRNCKHLIEYWVGRDSIPEHLISHQGTLYNCNDKGWGFPLYSKTEVRIFGNTEYQVYWPNDEYEWVVFSDSMTSWAYSPHELRWSFKNEPPCAQDMAMYARGVRHLEPTDIVTISKEPTNNKWHWNISALAAGVPISMTLNARAQWQNLKVGDIEVLIHPIDQDMRHAGGLEHMNKALCSWLIQEKEDIRRKLGK